MPADEKKRFRGLLTGGRAGDAAKARGRQISTNIGIQFAGRAITLVVGLVTFPTMARTLEPEGFGLYTAGLAYVGLFGILVSLGLTTAATQLMASDPDRESEWLGALVATRFVLSIVATVLCVASIPVLLSGDEDAQLVALIFAPTLLLGVPGSLMSVFQSRLRAAIPQAMTIAQSVLWLIVVLSLAVVGGDAAQFAIGFVLVAIVISVMEIVATRHFADVKLRQGWPLWRQLVRIGVPLGIAAVMISLYYRIDSVLLLKLDSAEEAGIYGVAYRFLDTLILLPGLVMATFFPVLSALYVRDKARTRRLVQRCAEVLFVITLPCFVVTLTLAEPIVLLLFGEDYEQSAGVLQVLMIAIVTIGFGTLAGHLASVLGMQWRLALYSTIGAVANIALNLVFIPIYGAYGAAATTVVTEVLTMTLMFVTVLHALRMRLAFGRLLRALIAGAGMGLVLFAVRPAGLFPALVVGTVVYGTLLVALRAVRIDELRTLRHA